jgi:hypothetical protein
MTIAPFRYERASIGGAMGYKVTAAIGLGLGSWSGFRIWRTRMSSRALSLATVMFLIGCLAAVQAQAENLDAGKSPSQLFAGTCSECHKSSRGLLRKVPAASLPGFLRQHYTTSGQMAAVLSAYLIANGAADRRPAGGEPKPGTDAKPGDAKPADQADRRGRRLRSGEPAQEAAKPDAEPRQAARPDADGALPQAERRGRKRLGRPDEAPDAAKPADGQAPAQAATERGPDGRSAARPRRGRPGSEEPPKTDAAKTDTSDTSKTDAAKEESAKGEPVKDAKPASETAKGEDKPEGPKPEATKPSGEGGLDAGKVEPPKATGGGDSSAVRADPVPPVTPAPATPPAPPAAASSPPPDPSPAPPASAAAPSEPPPAPAAPSAPPSSVTASAPPPAPSGPPAPPISQ